MTTTNNIYRFICGNATHDFYICHLRSGWYAIATRKGAHCGDPEGRTLASFTTRKSALNAVITWCGYMK